MITTVGRNFFPVVFGLTGPLLFTISFVSWAPARDLYVDNLAGDDANDGGAPRGGSLGSGPFKTLDQAMRRARFGDHIHIANTGEPYRESAAVQGPHRGGLSGEPLVIYGNGAVLDGSAPVPPQAWVHYRADLFRFLPPRKSYQQLFLDGIPLKRRRLEGGRFPALKPLEWCLYDQSIIFRPEKNRIPQSYNLSYADKRVGLTLYQIRGVQIHDLTIQGYQLDGVNAHDCVYETLLSGLICRGNGRSGVSVGGSSRVTLEASLLGNNGAMELRTEAFGQVWLDNCDLVGADVPKIVSDGGNVWRVSP